VPPYPCDNVEIMADRPRIVLVVAFAAAIALLVGLLLSSGTSVALQWRAGIAVPRSLAEGVTVVDRSVPVEVAPEISAWTGSELLTLGVSSHGRNVGAVYRPRSGRWRTMAEIPFGTALRGMDGVWTGRIWVVTGVLCDPLSRVRRNGRVACDPGSIVTAAYEPRTDMWRVVDAVPWPVSVFFGHGHEGTFGTGVGVLGDTAVFQINGEYYSFRPDSWDWYWMPHPPSPGPTACSLRGTLFTYDETAHTVVRLEPGATEWTATPRAPEGSPSATSAARVACADSHVYVDAPDSPLVLAFDPRRRQWSEVPSLPASARPVPDASRAVWFRPNAALALSPTGELSAYRAG
jgi:hypothetical protein